MAGAADVAHWYLDHLTESDLRLLSDSAAGGDNLRRRPDEVHRALGSPAVFERVLGRPQRGDPLLMTSPFLVFAVAVHRTAAELAGQTFVEERTGPRRRVPVFDVAALRRFLDDPLRRFFLIELLASYTHVASGSLLVRTGRGVRRHRYSELDPVRLASLLDVVPEDDHPGIYRRVGDLALFLTGVFPDHAAGALGAIGRSRLLRSLGGDDIDEPATSALEALGPRWYRAASSRATGPLTATAQVLPDDGEQFRQARRVLNVLTERHLFPYRRDWFGGAA